MVYRCKNCGANAVYSPEKGAMYCPHCEGIDSEEQDRADSLTQCVSCGAPIEITDYTSACKCQHCGTYMILEQRVEGNYEPHLILPFKIGKDQVKQKIKEEFADKLFLPNSFLSEAYLNTIEGIYVPFFMYDYDCQYDYEGEGKIIRTWTTGQTQYTETKVYRLVRGMDVTFERIPVDASITMDDSVMDLLEPYDYRALEQFKSKYMSGFYGEMKNMEVDVLEPRAREKAKKDARELLQQSLTGYSSVSTRAENLQLHNRAANYALLPVWNYVYQYRGKEYSFKINGQTGKVIGATPVSMWKWMRGGAIFYGLLVLGGYLLMTIGGMLE